jgi:hypothetical protein
MEDQAMPRLRVNLFVALAFALVPLTPAHAVDPPFKVFAATYGEALGPGESVSFQILVTRNSETCTVCTPTSTTCCTGVIRLSFENLPAGVTACFPRPAGQQCLTEIAADSAVAVLRADGSIAPGTYKPRVVAKANDGPNPRSQNDDFDLTLLPFSVHVPPTASLRRGSSQSLALSIERVAAGAGAIDFTLVSPDAGLTGTFNPDPATGDQAALQLSSAASLKPDNYFPTVRATLGTVVRSYDINVAVTPTFSIALSPATLALARGGSAEVAIAVDRDPGFTSRVAFTLAAPQGLTGTFSGPRRLTPEKLRLTASPGVAPGNYHVAVKGVAGGVTRTVTLRVRVGTVRPGG